MPWVKKNLVILIAAVISLGALGYAIFFVKQKKAADEEVSANLDQAAESFKSLITRKVHPGNPGKEKDDNIARAKEELAKMRSFMEEMREYLKGPVLSTNLNNQIFRAELDTTVAQLQREAIEAGVQMPNTNYWFTYNAYKTTMDFKGEVPGMAAELEDIRSIVRILYSSRVHSIAGLKRAPTSDSENLGTSDYMNKYVRTNDWAITTPYEVTFQGFSSELARVMEGFANAKQCFVVKSIGVAEAPEDRKPGAVAPPMMIPPPSMNPYDRYRRPGGFVGTPMPAPAPVARPTAGLSTVLDEKKLRFTLQVDSIRLKPK